LARVTNDWIAEEVKKNPKRFGAFCSLSMHRPAQAAQELRRAVKELGLVGAILNDWQATGDDGNGILLYDTPDFDPFWEAVQELKVPVYFHPKVFSYGCGIIVVAKSVSNGYYLWDEEMAYGCDLSISCSIDDSRSSYYSGWSF
jgi:predicted TIM-barrel fold metal-dependent hydrolase